MPSPSLGLALLGLPLVAAVAASRGPRQASRPAAESSRPGIYACVPDHPWEAVHRALLVRSGPDGREHGLDDLDPLLWSQTRHLLEDPAYPAAVGALDAFLSSNAERLLPDPIKRLLLQRDLWAVFDWLATVDRRREACAGELAKRIARAMRRVALTPEEIRALPDNYAAAVASRAFPDGPTPGERSEPFLPSDLPRDDASWVWLGGSYGEPIAPSHTHAFDGRSAFSVHLRLPGGREETLAYLKALRRFPNPILGEEGERRLDPHLPQFPPGTAVALVRRMLAIDDRGEVASTPIVESVQLRRFRSIENPAPDFGCGGDLFPFQEVFEFVLSRERLFTGVAGGLRSIGREEKEFPRFQTHGFDPLEGPRSVEETPVLWRCGSCHAQPGIYSVNSFTRISTGPGTIFHVEPRALPNPVQPTELRFQDAQAVAWKGERASLGYLRGLWNALPR